MGLNVVFCYIMSVFSVLLRLPCACRPSQCGHYRYNVLFRGFGCGCWLVGDSVRCGATLNFFLLKTNKAMSCAGRVAVTHNTLPFFEHGRGHSAHAIRPDVVVMRNVNKYGYIDIFMDFFNTTYCDAGYTNSFFYIVLY